MNNLLLQDYQYVYLLGVGGYGMSALARWFNAQGVQVFGYDRASTALTDQLAQEGIEIFFEELVATIPHKITQHRDKSLIVYTPAIPSKNQILTYLKAHGYALCKRSAVVGTITQRHFTLAVSGTHGKTTSSSLAAHVLHSAGKNLTAFLGSIAKGYDANLLVTGQANQDTIVVIEADEFDRFFLHLHPNIAIVTTVDPDHLDTYGDAQGFREAFKEFIDRLPTNGQAIVHQKAAQQLSLDTRDSRIVRYALADEAIRAANVRISDGYFYFDYVSEEVVIKDIQLVVPGYHNVENALAVITACLSLGTNADVIRQAMATFQGVKRRFDYIIKNEELIFLDDYAHHPVEITALLHAIRALYPDKKITAVFRPSLYTRTRDFAREFAQSLDLADQVFLLDLYPDREEPIEGVDAALIFEQMTLEQKVLCTTEDLIAQLGKYDKPQLIATVGSGGISNLIAPIKQFLLG